MTLSKRLRKTPIARSVSVALLALGSIATSQQANAQSGQTLERVEITGSNIKRSEVETAAPVQILTREDIQRSGKASVAEFLQTLAVDNQGSVPTTFSNGFAAGASGISLRGLGAASTLVLVNGRRIAPYGLADDGQKIFADLNVLPLEAVERVEILKDGGSAIYGSDAIAGVVNVILKKNQVGTVFKATLGQSRYGDGAESSAAITHGFGNLESDQYNVLLNFEVTKKGAIAAGDRIGRGPVGLGDYRGYGYDSYYGGPAGSILNSVGAAGDTLPAGSSVAGNVRKPGSLLYFSRSNPNTSETGFTKAFPGANCAKLSGGYQPQDAAGGCVIDANRVYSQIQPQSEAINFFGRGTRSLDQNTEAYAELNFYTNQSSATSTPSTVSSSVGSPIGARVNSGVSLGSQHPDNPYFGTAARLRYLATDVGPRISNLDSQFIRFVSGLKLTRGAWDLDTAILYSESKTTNERTGYLNRDVTFALLNPSAANVAAATASSAAYRALPAGTYWRIAENSNLNSRDLYAALSPTLTNTGLSKTSQIDFKGSREIGQLPGGPIGLAVGTEIRRESVRLGPTPGTEVGNIIGLGYSAYEASRTVIGTYAEALMPIAKALELNAAIRTDNYSEAGSSVTPKVGVKWRPVNGFALRGTFAQGFRAPGAAEKGTSGGVAAYTLGTDNPRCAVITPGDCSAGAVAMLTIPNTELKPEKSDTTTFGAVWDISPRTSFVADLFEIKRRNEINAETPDAAIKNGHVIRDLTSASNVPGDPGPIVLVLSKYINSSQTTIRGVDFDLKHRFDLDGGQKVTVGATATHFFNWTRVDPDGTVYNYNGTHGNCDVTNCIGTPKDRINFVATWEQGPWSVSSLASYRGSLKNILYKGATECADHKDYDGAIPGPNADCKISSFTTVDLSARYKLTAKTEIFGVVRNVFDKIPPLDHTTYGALGYNPLDYSGAVGRYLKVGVRHAF
jgi:iron complex outermembrane receptor protein